MPLPHQIKKQVIQAYTILQAQSSVLVRFIKSQTKLKNEYPKSHTQPLIFWCLEHDNNFEKTLSMLYAYGFNPSDYRFDGLTLWEKVIALSNSGKMEESRALTLFDVLLPFKQDKYILGNVSYYEKVKKAYNTQKELSELSVQERMLAEDFEQMLSLLPQNKQVLYKLLDSEQVDETEKSLLSYMCLEQCLLNTYYASTQDYSYYQDLATVEDLLQKGHLFKDDRCAYHTLSNLFYMQIEEHLSNRVLMLCYETFSLLKTRTKKMITRFLIKKNKEVTLFNLLSYGLNLNWTIKKENGEENIVALEMLGSIPMIKMILASNSFNICTTNKEGHNILHLLGTLPLMDNEVKNALLRKITKLDKSHQNYLFYQYDEHQMTPLYKALYQGEELLVDFLLGLGVEPEAQFMTQDESHHSALSFVGHLLNWQDMFNVENINIIWQKYHNEWSAKKLHTLLSSKLPSARQARRSKI